METTMQALRSNVAARLQNYRRRKGIEVNGMQAFTWGFLSLLEFTAEDIGDYRTQKQARRISEKLQAQSKPV